jgi:hypothetical protein
LKKHFETYQARWKIKKGDLERDIQKNCLDLSKYSEIKQNYNEITIINTEMFYSLMENTKYICSNEIIWAKVKKNQSEITCKSILKHTKVDLLKHRKTPFQKRRGYAFILIELTRI